MRTILSGVFLLSFWCNAQVWEVSGVKGVVTSYTTKRNFKIPNQKLELLPEPLTGNSAMATGDPDNPPVYIFTITRKPETKYGLGQAVIKVKGNDSKRPALFHELPDGMLVFTEMPTYLLVGGGNARTWAIHEKFTRKDGKHLVTMSTHFSDSIVGGVRTYSMSGWAKKIGKE
jgi:hypothetical protein